MKRAVSFFFFQVKATDSHMQKRGKINPPLLLEEEGEEEEGEEGALPHFHLFPAQKAKSREDDFGKKKREALTSLG